MLVSQTPNQSSCKNSFCSNEFAWLLATWLKTLFTVTRTPKLQDYQEWKQTSDLQYVRVSIENQTQTFNSLTFTNVFIIFVIIII